jgi:hypothetical protein
VIPNKVTNIHNTAGTFKVYDAGEALTVHQRSDYR